MADYGNRTVDRLYQVRGESAIVAASKIYCAEQNAVDANNY